MLLDKEFNIILLCVFFGWLIGFEISQDVKQTI